MLQKKYDILRMILMPLGEIIILVGAFLTAYDLRTITDGIPFIQLRTQYISPEQFFPFILYGVIIWLLIMSRAKLYTLTEDAPFFEEIRRVLSYAFFWFFVYIGFVYLTTGFLFSKEIPRLIILYTAVLATISVLIFRAILHSIWNIAYRKGFLPQKNILIIQENTDDDYGIFDMKNSRGHFLTHTLEEFETYLDLIRNRSIDAIMFTSGNTTHPLIEKVLLLARIYGIPCTYPQILPHLRRFHQQNIFLVGIPVVELRSISIQPWGRIMKRTIDIIFSSIALILLSPVMILIYFAIKLEDSEGPAIYKNRRIGQNGKIFTLYKFRYMYWKYCTKESYLQDGEKDAGLEYEESLKKLQNTREGPLYKIINDPRRLRYMSFIEKLSLDELPQLFNVFLGNMSMIGPRPHQPREVDLYDESDKQVLTIKPGITGMAQVYGREKNTFKEEVALDTYYIEHYSLPLDVAIFFRTILVIVKRPFQ